MEDEWQKNYTEKYEKKWDSKCQNPIRVRDLKPVYTPSDVADIDYSEIGMPVLPYTRDSSLTSVSAVG